LKKAVGPLFTKGGDPRSIDADKYVDGESCVKKYFSEDTKKEVVPNLIKFIFHVNFDNHSFISLALLEWITS
jgi:hypothetical protein